MKRTLKKNRGISVVMVNWNGLFLLKQSLDSFVKACKTYQSESKLPCEIIMVDNGSQDRSVDVVKDFYPEIRVLSLDKNYGFGEGTNKGAEIAKYDRLFFVNNDIYLPADILVILDEEFSKLEPNTFSISPQTNWWEGSKRTDRVFSSAITFEFKQGDLGQVWTVDNSKPTSTGLVPTVYGTGAALLVNASLFKKLGQFDPLFSPAYWEDVDVCYHAWKLNYPSYVTHKTCAWHKISASSTIETNSKKDYLQFRNFLIFMLLNISDAKIRQDFLKKCRQLKIRLSVGPRKQALDEVFGKMKKSIDTLYLKRKKNFKLTDAKVLEKTKVQGPAWRSPYLLD